MAASSRDKNKSATPGMQIVAMASDIEKALE